MDCSPNLFGVIHRVHGATAISIPKCKYLIAGFDDFFITNEWSFTAILIIFRKVYNQFNAFLFRIFRCNGIYSNCPATYYCGDSFWQVFFKIQGFNASASNYSRYHNQRIMLQKSGFLNN